jgi:hypothetical protein
VAGKKRREAEPEDLSGNLIVQLGVATEQLNRHWYERNTGNALKDIQRRVVHPVIKWMAATLDGVIETTGAVFEAKFMLPWSFSEEGAAEKYMAQLQHNMWVTNATTAVLSIITGGGKWVEITVAADSLYQHLLLTAEKKFWRCVESGGPPRLFFAEPPPNCKRYVVRSSVPRRAHPTWPDISANCLVIEGRLIGAPSRSGSTDERKRGTGLGLRRSRVKRSDDEALGTGSRAHPAARRGGGA